MFIMSRPYRALFFNRCLLLSTYGPDGAGIATHLCFSYLSVMENSAVIRYLICIVIILCLSIHPKVSAQSCLPEGITFNTQSQVDSFPILYPNCIEIEGDLTIKMGDISNLDALNSITIIHGDLDVRHTTLLTNLSGLNNLTMVMGFLDIYNNSALSSLAGLNNLTSIGIGVFIEHNPALISLEGLNNLERIEERFFIWENEALTSLSGLNKLGYIGTALEIRKNEVLENISDLGVLDSIGAGFLIRENPSLTSIEGLSSLVYTGGGVDIGMNPQLSSLQGLENLTVVGHELSIWGVGIYNNDKLSNLSGLDNVTTIKSGLFILGNLALQNMEGLQSLNHISGSLIIWENPLLDNVESLINLDSIGASLSIERNTILNSLAGLDNIAAASISDLSLRENDSLSVCEVKSICDYIADPNGYVLIENNIAGCNSKVEVELACESAHIHDFDHEIQIITYPNPFTTSTTIEYELKEISNIQFTIYNVVGEVVYKAEDRIMPKGSHTVTWSPGLLPGGMYYAVLRSDEGSTVTKLIKQ